MTFTTCTSQLESYREAIFDESSGKADFYNRFLPRVDSGLSINDVLADHNDGIVNGNLLEFKVTINDTQAVLLQAVKYLSAQRVKGKEVPANIVLVSLSNNRAFIYESERFIKDIEKIYVGAASKNNSGFISDVRPRQLNFMLQADAEELIKILRTKNFTKINIDENCILGWATRFYSENPKANKSDFIGDIGQIRVVGEIRRPTLFKDYIHPYTGATNERFRYLMDKLNDDLSQKDLGAFYTPKPYVGQATELLRQAIERVPEGNDYIILDRCAGTGNLEQFLTEEELSHCVVSTFEYYEYKVLMELFGDKVRHVIPPVETSDTYNNGTVLGADALSYEYVHNPILNSYIQNPRCTIIMLENPPFAESGSMTRGRDEVLWKKSYASLEMKKDEEVKGTATNDLANIFIWSAFKYYLRQATDSYVLFSPIKYWKSQHLVGKKFIKGFAFNRRHFHAKTDACISCILWSNEADTSSTEIGLRALNIVDGNLVDEGVLPIKKVYRTISQMFTERLKTNDDGVVCEYDGSQSFKRRGQIKVKRTFDERIVGYLVADAFGFDNPRLTSSLLRCARYNGHGSFITVDDFLYRLPLFSASRYTDNDNNWKIMSQLMKTSDRKVDFLKSCHDGSLETWLLKNLLWVCLTNQAHMRSFDGADGRFYRNELCLDTTNGETLASQRLANMHADDEERGLLQLWKEILSMSSKTSNYVSKYTYGIYQIEQELNTYSVIQQGRGRTEKVFDYPELNGKLASLKTRLRDYYLRQVAPILFEYELLK